MAKTIKRKYAVISVGAENDYGHPHQEALAKLAAAGIKVYRTDRNGTVVFVSDGKTLTVRVLGSKIVPRAPNAAASATSGAEGFYIGNKNSRKFHRPDCLWTQKIAPYNRVYFKKREEAIQQGYMPCKVCKP